MGFDRTKAIEQKNRIQERAVEIFDKNCDKGINKILLTWATGVGKTLGALKMLERQLDKKPMTGYLICKEHSHVDNWKKDIKLHKKEKIGDVCEMFLYSSLHKYTSKGFVDFVILDECHAITPARMLNLLDIIGPDTLLICLSATVNSIKKSHIDGIALYNVPTLNVSIEKAIDLGILPSPTIYVHRYKLDDKEVNQTYTLTKGASDKREHFKSTYKDYKKVIKGKKAYSVEISCTEAQYMELIDKEVESRERLYFTTGEEWAKNLWVNAGSKRKKAVAELKTSRAERIILEEFKGFRYICFTGSKDQCNKLSNGKNFVHSDIDKKEVIKRKDLFNTGKIDSLYVVNMFRESINLVNVEKGLIVQLDNVKLSFIQMLGRVFRSDIPEMHIIVFEGTKDISYLKNVMTGMSSKYVITINEDDKR